MPSPKPLLNGIGRCGFNLLRWLACEFLPMSVRSTLSTRLTDLCRLLGSTTAVSLVVFSTRNLVHAAWSEVWYAWVFDVILAILVGRLVKEGATWVSAWTVNAFGFDFYRRGFTLGGRAYREVFRVDGTWRRCEFDDRQTICDWTDLTGAYKQSVSRPRLRLD